MNRGHRQARACWRPWPAEAIRADPLGYLAQDRAAQRWLADQLEAVADALPLVASRAGAAADAAQLRRLVAQSQPVEEAALFALIETHANGEGACLRQIALARREAATVAGIALELADDLDMLARDGGVAQAEALGFRLRACFDALRRRLDWVEAAILPHAVALLTPPRAAALGERLAAMVEGQPARARAGFAVIDGQRSSRAPVLRPW